MKNIIKSLREQKGYSQQDLANELGITRQTLIKYENNNALDTLPLDIVKKLSNLFEISYESIIDNNLELNEESTVQYIIQPTEQKREQPLRINIPQKNIEKFKEVLLYILNKVGAKANIGQTVIYKLLYFIDFDYYELFEEQLTGAEYIKNKFGPTPVDFRKIIDDMKKNNELQEIQVKYFEHKQTKYLPNRLANINYLSARELQHIDKELERLSDKTATELTELSHKDIPWISAKDLSPIEYEAVFYRTKDTSVRSYTNNEL